MNKEVLHIEIRESGTTRVLKLTGELDSYTSDRLRSICETWLPGARKVVVNLDKLDYIDSSGLAALVGMWVRARDSGVELALTCRNRRINQIMEITGLYRLFTPVATGIIPQSAYGAVGMVPAAAKLTAAVQPNAIGRADTIAGMTAGKAA